MERKFWARRGNKQVGPFPTREAAINAFRTAHPFAKPDYAAASPKNQILSGYGEFGAHFDIQWSHAK